MLSDDLCLEAGMYNFELDGENDREVVEGCFTYL